MATVRRRGKEQSTAGKEGDEVTEKQEDASTEKGKDKKTDKKAKKGRCCFCSGRLLTVLLIVGVAFFLADRIQVKKYKRQLQEHLDHWNITLPRMDALDALGDFELPGFGAANNTERIGITLAEAGLKPKYPVIVIPGFVTSGLELWKGKPCGQKFFRKRVWGSMSMTTAFFRSTECWLEHMGLDEATGLDPEGIKLRTVLGLEAVDYFIAGFHVWAKLIEALADLGYDTNNMESVSYDWRLSIPNMETRDGYFTRLRASIELMHLLQKEKVAVVSHSWGDNVFRNFLFWAEQEEEGWVEKHIANYINVSGPVLGVPKSVTAMLSGEMRDTAELGPLARYVTENLVPRQARTRLFRTWGSLIGMLPVGGTRVWGNTTWAPDDTPEMREKNQTYGAFIKAMEVNENTANQAEATNRTIVDAIRTWIADNPKDAENAGALKDYTVDEALCHMLKAGGPTFAKQVDLWGAALAHEHKPCKKERDSDARSQMLSPLTHPLPKAPSMRFFCLYGVGKPAERSYSYLHLQPGKVAEAAKDEKDSDEEGQDGTLQFLWKLNTESADPDANIDYGVMSSDGDGTVPLISLGLMCQKGWRTKALNPSGIKIISREFPHKVVPIYKDLRGGPDSSEHVDILGNIGVISDVLHIAAGKGDTLEDRVTSDIPRIADGVEFDP